MIYLLNEEEVSQQTFEESLRQDIEEIFGYNQKGLSTVLVMDVINNLKTTYEPISLQYDEYQILVHPIKVIEKTVYVPYTMPAQEPWWKSPTYETPVITCNDATVPMNSSTTGELRWDSTDTTAIQNNILSGYVTAGYLCPVEPSIDNFFAAVTTTCKEDPFETMKERNK